MKILPLTSLLLLASCASATGTAETKTYSGRYIAGEGDMTTLESLDAAFESARPSARMANLSLMYKRDWNGFVEAPQYWPGWWIQNSFGASYGLMPFIGMEEPYASWIANAQGMWFNAIGDGKRKDFRGLVGPDGCLCDATIVFLNGGGANGFGDPRSGNNSVEQTDGKVVTDFVSYKQGDGGTNADWYMGCNAAALVMESDRLLVRHDVAEAKPRLAQLKRVAALLESRHDPERHLLLIGKGANLLAPSYAGGRQKDGTMGKGFLTEVSVNYAAGLERLAEVCLLCGEPENAARYRVTAEQIRGGLLSMRAPGGYFIGSEDLEGTRHGVFGAAKHGYFESHPNHDAGAFRVDNDADNKTIVRYMLDKVKGPQAPGNLAPFGLMIPNYPSYDDHTGEGDMSYGNWVNGGVWPQNQGPMNIACMRAGEFTHPFTSWQTMRRFMEGFRSDSPLGYWGKWPWGGPQAQPHSLSYDAWGPSAGLMRGLFEYGYAANGLRLWPHIPPGITRLSQKMPASFGHTRVYIAATGTGTVSGAVVDGRKVALDADGSLFLPLTGAKQEVKVEFVLGDAKPQGVEVTSIQTPVPPASDVEFWDTTPKSAFAPPASANPWPLGIGATPGGGARFTGQVKGVRIYRAALTEAEVAARAQNKGEPAGLLAEYPFDAPPQKGKFSGAKQSRPGDAEAFTAALIGDGSKQEPGSVTIGENYVEIPASDRIDFFDTYTLELWVRPTRLDDSARLMDRTTPGTDDGYLLDYVGGGKTLRLITPWGILQGEANLQVGQWQHLTATCGADGQLRLYANGRKIAEVQGRQPQPRAAAKPIEKPPFAAAGAFLTAMEQAGLGDTFEAGQARVVVQMITALHERRRLAAAGELRMPVLKDVRAADQRGVDKLYRDETRFILGGLQDHLLGHSLQKLPVHPAVLKMAKETGLIP